MVISVGIEIIIAYQCLQIYLQNVWMQLDVAGLWETKRGLKSKEYQGFLDLGTLPCTLIWRPQGDSNPR